MNTPSDASTFELLIRVQLTDGAIESFIQDDKQKARKIWQTIDSVDSVQLFSQQCLIIAGTHSKSVFVCSEIVRIDFTPGINISWKFPEGYLDIVELSELDLKKRAHFDQPELRPKREQHTSVGDLLVSFLKLNFKGSPPIFLMVEFSIKLPAESQSFLRFLLSKTSFHMRLRGGGVGLVNLANLTGYTVYPGVAQVPADAWFAEPLQTNSG